MRKKVLFITGSINQTSQMHQISMQLPDYDCWFSQYFADSGLINFLIKNTSLLNSTILAGQFKENAERYLRDNNLKIDYQARLNKYDLVVYCSDMIVPDRMRNNKTIWVQEGMIDPMTFVSRIVKSLDLPIYLSGNTSLNGSTNICDIYCAASPGYKEHLSRMGTDAKKIVVTGIPNYDNLQKFTVNNFPYHNYVMVATTDMRETYRYENRRDFIKEAVRIARGRRLLFKLHPNENFERAQREIRQYAPADTLIFHSGNTNEMIANCDELITQYSTVVYVGIALGKKVHSWFDVDTLYKQMPVQNNGTSAANIAGICRSYIEFRGDKADFLKYFRYPTVAEQEEEEVAL